MKSSFGRSFFIVATILLLSLVLLGTSFQMLINNYITETTVSDLKQDGQILADLAAAYSLDGSLNSRDFLLNLDIATKISSFDAVICNSEGKIVICSCYPNPCNHIGWQIDQDYLQRVLEQGGDTSTGMIQGLYTDSRYVVCLPISNDHNYGDPEPNLQFVPDHLLLRGAAGGGCGQYLHPAGKPPLAGDGKNRKRFRPRRFDRPGTGG